MKTLLVLEKANHGKRKMTRLAKRDGDVNRISVCYNGIKGYINRSGSILCRKIEADKIMAQSQKVSNLMEILFPDDFKGLKIIN